MIGRRWAVSVKTRRCGITANPEVIPKCLQSRVFGKFPRTGLWQEQLTYNLVFQELG